MWIVELHKSGLPHLHMLLFEQRQGQVTKRDIERAWGWGFVKAKLTVEPEECAKYVVKYMSKAGAECTVRASLHFGTPLGAAETLKFLQSGKENHDPTPKKQRRKAAF